MSMTPQQIQALLRAGQAGSSLAGKYAPTSALGAASPYLGNAASGLGIASGIQQGGVSGYGSAAANTGKLAGSLTGNKALSSYGANAGNLLNIYNGIKQGGVGGYGGAAVNAAQLGSNLGAFGGASGAIGNAAGYAAIPLSLYNEVNNWESGNTGADALGGAGSGAAIGTMIMPGIGTALGALVGGAAGALSSAFGPGRVDPENAPFEGYTHAYNKAATGADANKVAQSVQNPYTALAGYFDLRKPQLKGSNSIYYTYGRKGEQKFTTDMTGQIDNAFKSGQYSWDKDGHLVQHNPGGGSTTYTNPNDYAGQLYQNAVQPWVNKMGKWDDSNKAAMQGLLTQMTGQYVAGQAGQDWKGIGGDSPFANIYGATKHARGGAVYRHYDDGGSVDYFTPTAGGYEFQDPQLQDLSGYFDQNDPYNVYSGINADLGDYGNTVNASNNPYAYGYNDPSSGGSSSSGSTSSGLANLLKGLGISGNTASSLAPYAALAPILGSLFGLNKNQAQQPGLPSQYSGQALNMPTPTNTRQQNNLSGMSMQDWLHAGEGPEIQNYQNNALPATQMSAPSQQAAQALSATSGQPFAGGYQYAPIPGGANKTVGGVAPQTPTPGGPPNMHPMMTDPGSAVNMQPTAEDIAAGQSYLRANPRAMGMAAGGPYDNPEAAYGSAVGHVRGPGDGTSDSIKLRNAWLSNGEYVVDAPTVSILGAGSNDAGAAKLDAFRAHARKHAGKHLVKGKQPMKGVDPSAYFFGGGA